MINGIQNLTETINEELLNTQNPQQVEILLKRGANVNVKGNKRYTPLHYAVKNGNVPMVLTLLGAEGIDVNPEDDSGNTPLHLAASYNRTAIAIQLLKAEGINVDAQDYYGNTPLHTAARSKHTNMVKKLLNRGANFNVKDKYGRTPIMIAHNASANNIVEILQERGAKLLPANLQAKHDNADIVRIQNVHLPKILIGFSSHVSMPHSVEKLKEAELIAQQNPLIFSAQDDTDEEIVQIHKKRKNGRHIIDDEDDTPLNNYKGVEPECEDDQVVQALPVNEGVALLTMFAEKALQFYANVTTQSNAHRFSNGNGLKH